MQVATEKFLAWQRQSRLTPSDLLRPGSHSLRAVLLPFWLFDCHVHVRYTGLVGAPSGDGGGVAWRDVGWSELPPRTHEGRIYASYKFRRDFVRAMGGKALLLKLQPLPLEQARAALKQRHAGGGDDDVDGAASSCGDAGGLGLATAASPLLHPPTMRQAIAWELLVQVGRLGVVMRVGYIRRRPVPLPLCPPHCNAGGARGRGGGGPRAPRRPAWHLARQGCAGSAAVLPPRGEAHCCPTSISVPALPLLALRVATVSSPSPPTPGPPRLYPRFPSHLYLRRDVQRAWRARATAGVCAWWFFGGGKGCCESPWALSGGRMMATRVPEYPDSCSCTPAVQRNHLESSARSNFDFAV